MRRSARRGLALALGTGLGICAAGVLLVGRMLARAGWPSVEDMRGNLEHELVGALAPARAQAIREEFAHLAEHPWAGRYTTPGGQYEELLLAPDGGFTLHVQTHCGNCTGFEAVGRVRELAPDRLLLEPERAHWARYMRSRDPQVLHLIEWEGRRMAVFEAQAERFCAMLTSGESMPEAYIRRGEEQAQPPEELRPPGRPLLPEPLRALAREPRD